MELTAISGSSGRKRMKQVIIPAMMTTARNSVASKQEARLLEEDLDLRWRWS